MTIFLFQYLFTDKDEFKKHWFCIIVTVTYQTVHKMAATMSTLPLTQYAFLLMAKCTLKTKRQNSRTMFLISYYFFNKFGLEIF